MKQNSKKHGFFLTGLIMAFACTMVIWAGVAGMNLLAASKKEPAQKKIIKKNLSVTTIPVLKQDTAVYVSGYGQAKPVNLVDISPEISGKIVQKYKTLDQGRVVQKGELLFRIDSTDYETEAEKADIKVKLQENQISQLQLSFKKDQERLETIRKSTRLAKTEFSRLKQLYEKERVGTLSNVEQAEQSYNTLLDTERNMVKSVALYPLQIAQAQSNLSDAMSDLKTAQLNVKRCLLTAPFTGRIKEESIQMGGYIAKGSRGMILADDTALEIEVPLSEQDAFEILGLRSNGSNFTWFSDPANMECHVETVGQTLSASVPAKVDRIVKYDPDSRSIYIAVRIYGDGRFSTDSVPPVVDGMFCKVSLKVKTVSDAVKIPVALLNSDNTIYLARNNRLTTLPVTRIMEDGDNIYISGDFEPQDQIITTKLSHPVENRVLEIADSTEQAYQTVSAITEKTDPAAYALNTKETLK